MNLEAITKWLESAWIGRAGVALAALWICFSSLFYFARFTGHLLETHPDAMEPVLEVMYIESEEQAAGELEEEG
ncbi:MAG: hypothetical protein ACLFU6_01850 [Candidatus Hydrogenedentota bacterium]